MWFFRFSIFTKSQLIWLWTYNWLYSDSKIVMSFMTSESRKTLERCLFKQKSVWVKALLNRDTLLRTHRCPWCSLGCANWETYVADTKCFWTKQKHFLCPGHKICVRNKCCARGQTRKHLCRQQCVRNNVSTTMCPRLPGPLYGRVYLGLFRTGTVKHYPYINAGKFVARSSLSITYKKMAVTRNSLLPQWKPVDWWEWSKPSHLLNVLVQAMASRVRSDHSLTSTKLKGHCHAFWLSGNFIKS